MRKIIAIALVAAAGCSVDSDSTNDQVTLEYDQNKVEKTARDTARTAKGVASGVGNVAASTGRAIKKEVGDIDVDVDVKRTPSRDRAEGNASSSRTQ